MYCCCFIFLMRRRPPRSTRTDKLFPYTTLFRSVWRPVLAALDWIRSKVDGGCRFVPLQDVPIDEVIPARCRSSVIDDDGRVYRISYELCVLKQLRDRIRTKGIRVVGADRDSNPDDDLTKDSRLSRYALH